MAQFKTVKDPELDAHRKRGRPRNQDGRKTKTNPSRCSTQRVADLWVAIVDQEHGAKHKEIPNDSGTDSIAIITLGALTQIIVQTLKSGNFAEIFGLSGFFQAERSTQLVRAAPKPEPHTQLQSSITFDSELRSTHRFWRREALSVLFDSIPLGSMHVRMIFEAHELRITCGLRSCECRIGVLGYSMTQRESRMSIELGVQTFQVQVQAWKVGEAFLWILQGLVSPKIESSAVLYGELGTLI
ncbi:hypothetical protein PIB30_035144 [Stylosanthes scabra]|uniref:Uncharacterized protein n=1 Tax=Stylosanthes scabra TaxID=79078 RepID=A0ABU6VEZ3_9FABA|nr:hypothetical protein [Stylosanthes scabra]